MTIPISILKGSGNEKKRFIHLIDSNTSCSPSNLLFLPEVGICYPSKFFSSLQSYCPHLSVVLLSYDGRSTLIRLDRTKFFGRVVYYLYNKLVQEFCLYMNTFFPFHLAPIRGQLQQHLCQQLRIQTID